MFVSVFELLFFSTAVLALHELNDSDEIKCVGPCVNDECPNGLGDRGMECINDQCCAISIRPAARTRRSCKDKMANCASLSILCSNFVYESIMTSQCSRTCGKCPNSINSVVETEECFDQGSNCRQVAALCRNPTYEAFMGRYCKRTCGFC